MYNLNQVTKLSSLQEKKLNNVSSELFLSLRKKKKQIHQNL